MKSYAQIMALIVLGAIVFGAIVDQATNPRPWLVGWIGFGVAMAIIASIALHTASNRWIQSRR